MKLHRLNGSRATLCGHYGRLVPYNGRSAIMEHPLGRIYLLAKLDEEPDCYYCLGLPHPSKGKKRPHYVRRG